MSEQSSHNPEKKSKKIKIFAYTAGASALVAAGVAVYKYLGREYVEEYRQPYDDQLDHTDGIKTTENMD